MARIRSDITEQVFEIILERIDNYTYASGDVVPEAALAAELGMSRTPVREAMMRLQDMGLLERAGSKIMVRAITLVDIEELMEMREAVECTALKSIVKKGGLTKTEQEELDKINQSLQESIKRGDFEGNFYYDALFHETMVKICQNTRMLEVFRRTNLQTRRFRWMTMLTPSRYHGTIEEHEEILACLLEKDMKKTHHAIEKHIAHSSQNYREILRDGKWSKLMGELQNMSVEEKAKVSK